MKNDSKIPYVPASENMAEITLASVLLGVLLGVVLSAANAYLGLYAGITVSASIPAAVISMGILRGLLKRGTILENNHDRVNRVARVFCTAGKFWGQWPYRRSSW